MNVVLHSALSVFYLLVANFAFGVITAAVGLLLNSIQRFVAVTVRNRFITFREYCGLIFQSYISVIIADLFTCLLAACFMLVTAFIYNSGNFRLVSIPIFIIGFAFGKIALGGIVAGIIDRILFCIKWILDIVAFPVIWFATLCGRLLSKIIKNLRNKYRTKILTKYTKYCFANIKDEAKYGLLDDYYKELENERTV